MIIWDFDIGKLPFRQLASKELAFSATAYLSLSDTDSQANMQ